MTNERVRGTVGSRVHIRIGKSGLFEGLAPIQGVVEAKKSLPILSHVLMEATDGQITLFGTDLDVGIRIALPTETIQPGAVALSAKKLYDIVRELPDEPIEIQVDEELVTTIRCHRSHFKLKGLPRDDFPSLPSIKAEGGVGLPPKTLREMIRRTIFAVSTDQTRYTLNGILYQLTSADMRMVATDGHRLAMVKVDRAGVTGDAQMEGLIVPRKAMAEILKLFRDDSAAVWVRLADNHLVVEQGRQTLVTRLIEGQFPNYDQVIPAPSGKGLVVRRDVLEGALRRTSAILGERTTPTVMDLKPNRLVVSCANLDLGEAREEVEVEYSGQELSVGFNARYVLDFLGAVDAERVSLGVSDPLSPGLFRPAEDGTYTCVIMPMRI